MNNYRQENGENHSNRTLWKTLRRWLQPGLGIKRWFLLLVFGTSLIGLGLAYFLLDIYRANPDSPYLVALSLTFIPRLLRALLLGLLGTSAVIVSIIQLNRNLLEPYLRPGRPLVDVVARHRKLGRGPKIVALGGGTGLSTLLRGLKTKTGNLTAIVTVADDGGSSGRLRRSLGLPPPGDVRSCLAALSDDEDLLTQLFQYRFMEGEELGGHSFGNLFIAALSAVTGSFDRGVVDAGRLLSINGRVLPSTLTDVSLIAEKMPALDLQAVRVEGESQIPELPGRIQRVYLEPSAPPAHPDAIHAILNADLILLGPGSLYTSLMPNLLVPDIADAIRSSRAFRMYICNVATQVGETDGYDCERHVEAICEHIGHGLIDLVVANDCLTYSLPDGVEPVCPPEEGGVHAPYYMTELVDPDRPWRHDAIKLADSVIALLEERTGPLDLPAVDEEDTVNP